MGHQQQPKRIQSNAAPKANLPEIVKRGPINNQRHNKRVVGLSLQKRDEPVRGFRAKRGSLESTTAKPTRAIKARNAVIRA